MLCLTACNYPTTHKCKSENDSISEKLRWEGLETAERETARENKKQEEKSKERKEKRSKGKGMSFKIK